MTGSFQAFLQDLEKGEVENLLMMNVNPVYSLGGFDAMEKAGFTLYMGSALNETAGASKVICPTPHYLEAWGDAEPVKGSYSLQQPCIHPLFNSRAFQDSLLMWAGGQTSYHEMLEFWWKNVIAPIEERGQEQWWVKTLQAGFYHDNREPFPAVR